MSDSDSRSRRRGIALGEIISLAALIVSALGLWITWQSTGEDRPTRVVEQRQPIPLTLQGAADRDGRELVLTPAEPGHALVSLTLTIRGSPPIEVASDGRLDSNAVEAAVKDTDRDRKRAGKIPVRIAARYVEAGAERRGGGTYVLRYRWEGGGLFGGRSLRLVGLSR
ncbi:MAG TPA: hypothetical protein VFU20_03825 [Sphingomicrobium sp.]|nr:hypothetical protein [Sphingomicrobium sp.]